MQLDKEGQAKIFNGLIFFFFIDGLNGTYSHNYINCRLMWTCERQEMTIKGE